MNVRRFLRQPRRQAVAMPGPSANVAHLTAAGDAALRDFKPRYVCSGSSLCENSLEPRTRRIVFSIVFSQEKSPLRSVSTTTNLRQKFYAQVQRRSFHTAWVKRRNTRKEQMISALPPIADIPGPLRAFGDVRESLLSLIQQGFELGASLVSSCPSGASLF
jgi:hypothetical protein